MSSVAVARVEPYLSEIAATARDWHRGGWSTFISKRSTSRVNPAPLDGRRIDPTSLTVDEETLVRWANQTGGTEASVSVQLGAASANAFAINLSSLSEAVSAAVVEIIESVLGPAARREWTDAEWMDGRGLVFFYQRSLVYRLDTAGLTGRRLKLYGGRLEVVGRGGFVVDGDVAEGGGTRVGWIGGVPVGVDSLTEVTQASLDAALEAVAAINVERVLANAQTAVSDDERDEIRNFFSDDAPVMRANGWNILPQSRDGKRRPSIIDGRMIQWSLYQPERPSADVFETWRQSAYDDNIAVVLGRTSGNLAAIDIDCLDASLSSAVRALAIEVLGETCFERIGRAPKTMLFYRMESEATWPKKPIRFAAAGDVTVNSGDMVELAGRGQLITIGGLHHKTRREFVWPRESPLTASPMAATLITDEQINEFERRLPEVRAIYSASKRSAILDISNLPVSTGSMRLAVPAAGDWAVDPTTGLITDGREAFLTKLVFELVRANPSSTYTAEDYDQLSKMAFDVFTAKADRTGRWNDSFIWREAYSRVQRNCQSLMAGLISPNRRAMEARAGETIVVEPRPVVTAEAGLIERHGEEVGPLAWLTPRAFNLADRIGNRGYRLELVSETAPGAIEALREERRLRTDIEQQANWLRIDQMLTEIAKSLEVEVRLDKRSSEMVTLVRSPTGSGKTTKILARLLESMRQSPLPRGVRILFLVRSHENADDIVDRLERDSYGVRRCGDAVHRVDGEIVPVQQLSGPLTGAWKGRSASHKTGSVCSRPEDLQALIKAELASSPLCVGSRPADPLAYDRYRKEKLRRKTEDHQRKQAGLKPARRGKLVAPETVEIECYFKKKNLCAYYNQPHLFADCSLIIASHYYLDAKALPPFLDQSACVVVDEDPSLNLLKTYFANIEAFLDPIGVIPTQSEMARGIEDVDLASDAKVAAGIAYAEMQAGRDPAKAFLARKDWRSLISAAKACATRSRRVDVDPSYDSEAIARVAAEEKGKPRRDRKDQAAFWSVLEERILGFETAAGRQILEDGIAAAETKDKADDLRRAIAELPPKPHGLLDARFQLVTCRKSGDTAARLHIRTSRRAKLNFAGRPIMVLAAAGRPKVIAKVFGRQCRLEDVPARIQMRVVACLDMQFSNSAILPHVDDTEAKTEAKRVLLKRIRAAILKAATLHGRARILVVCSQPVKDYLSGDHWGWPENVDWGHCGGLAGLNFAEHYPVVMTVGRSEMPIQMIDALAAALGYDDDVPYVPYDKRGDGLVEVEGPDGKAKIRTLYRPMAAIKQPMRSGETLEREAPMMTEKYGWAHEVEMVWREGEILQAAGRVRPVYKTDQNAPTWIHLGASLPGEFVVDRVVSLNALAGDAELYDMMRLAGGVLSMDASLWQSVMVKGLRKPASLQAVIDRLPAAARSMFLDSVHRYYAGDGLTHLGLAWRDADAALADFAVERDGLVHPLVDCIEVAEGLGLVGREYRKRQPRPFHRRIALEIACIRVRLRAPRCQILEELAQGEADELADWRWYWYGQLGAPEDVLAATNDIALLAKLIDVDQWDAAARAAEAGEEIPASAPVVIEAEAVDPEVATIEPAAMLQAIALDDEDLEYLEPRYVWATRPSKPPPVYASG